MAAAAERIQTKALTATLDLQWARRVSNLRPLADERASLFIEPNASRAGAGRITLGVSGLDPDGNAMAFAEGPDA
jgi:hypothetical protein